MASLFKGKIKMPFTDDQIIVLAKKHMTEFPHCSRASLRARCHTSYERLERLSPNNFRLPLKCPKNKAHLFKKDDKWRKFKLWGSPTSKPN